MTRRRVRDLVDLLNQRESYRMNVGLEVNDEVPFEEDDDLYGMGLEVVGDDEDVSVKGEEVSP